MNTISKIAATLIGLVLLAGITAACGGGGHPITDTEIAANIQYRCGFSVVVDDAHDFDRDPQNADKVLDAKTFKQDGRVTNPARPVGDALWVDTGNPGHYVCPGDTQGNYVWDGNQWQRLTD